MCVTFPHPPRQSCILTNPLNSARDPLRISNFRQLQELEVKLLWPTAPLWTLFSSITSTKLRKIIFPAGHILNAMIRTQQLERWAVTDGQLCELVDQLCSRGYCYTLEVELQLEHMAGKLGKYNFANFLPKFGERGIVTIIHTDDNFLVYSSANNH